MSFSADQPSYRRLRNQYSERTESFVFWVGAGTSIPAGYPSWTELRALLLKDFRASIELEDEPDRSRRLTELDSIEAHPNLWVAFERLQALGKSSYMESIREHLGPRRGAGGQVPEVLNAIWRLEIDGVLNLNLDQLATRAFSRARPGKDVLELTGQQAARNISSIRSRRRFIVNLHGILGDVGSWVFTHGELSALTSEQSYQDFLTAILASRTVVFVGIGVDDVAVGSILERLSSGTSMEAHYWITDRSDADTRSWAEQVGLQQVAYSSPDGSHSEVVEALDGLARYRPRDDSVGPVVPSLFKGKELGEKLSPEELAKLPSEEIRHHLNKYAIQILGEDPAGDPNQDVVARYNEFQQEYRKAIYSSWYVDLTDEKENTLFGYTLERKLGDGGFGHVYLARDSHGALCAVKLLRREVFDDVPKFGSFRRGVRAMRFLGERDVGGIVAYKSAFEMPAAVVMDYIDGANLGQAIATREIAVQERLQIALSLAQTLREAHRVPERVLHRDVRPQNVMLEGFFDQPPPWHALLLDFDLSWHRDAQERSIQLSGAGALAYAAPEQLGFDNSSSTRSALVDSFGLGMTMFALFSMREPNVAEYRTADWQETVQREVERATHVTYAPMGKRLARLVSACTQASQSRRPDMASIVAELERLVAVQSGFREDTPLELVSEALLHQSTAGEYAWSEDDSAGTATFPGGFRMTVLPDLANNRVCVRGEWSSIGFEARRGLARYLPDAVERAQAALKKVGWQSVTGNSEAQSAALSASCDRERAVERFDALVQGVERSRAALNFS